MRRLILIFVILSLLAGKEPYVILISFDGFRYDYADRVETPNLDAIRNYGVKAESLQPVFPTKTFPNHYSIVTGAYSATHRITGNRFYDKEFKEIYSLGNRDAVQDAKWYGAEPIWVTAERQGISSAVFFWPGSEAPVKGMYPSTYMYYDGSVPFETRIDSVITWLGRPEKTRPQLILLYFSEPDHTGHGSGPESADVDETVRQMDELLGDLLERTKQFPFADDINFIVVSDHGMTEISTERIIPLDDYIELSDVISDIRGPFAQLDMKHWWQKFFISRKLHQVPHVTVYAREDIPQRFHFVNRNTRDYLLVADKGWLISTRSDMENRPINYIGTHGYDPEVKDMHGIFYAYGSAFQEGVQIDTFENIHIYPLICRILDLQPYSDAPDAPEGSVQVFESVLKQRQD